MSVTWSPGMKLEFLEKQVIEQAMRFYQGRKVVVAEVLGITTRTLDNKLNKYEEENKAGERERELTKQREQTERDYQRNGRPGSTPTGKSSNTSEGVRVEPAAKVTPQHFVSVSKREEVQEVLCESSPEGGIRKRG